MIVQRNSYSTLSGALIQQSLPDSLSGSALQVQNSQQDTHIIEDPLYPGYCMFQRLPSIVCNPNRYWHSFINTASLLQDLSYSSVSLRSKIEMVDFIAMCIL